MLQQQIEQDFQKQFANVKHDDPFRSARINSIKNENKEDLDALNSLKNKEEKSKKRKLTKSADTKLNDVIKNKKIKTMTDFDKNEFNNIKSIAIKGNTTIDVTSRFIKGKMLMFAKVSIKSFVYDLMDVFCFPTEKVRRIHDLYSIIPVFLQKKWDCTKLRTSTTHTFVQLL